MSRAIRYVECAHCGETVGTYEADELVRMICDAYQTGVFSGKEQS